MTDLTRLRSLVKSLNSPQSKRRDTMAGVLYEARREVAEILAEMEAGSPDVVQTAPSAPGDLTVLRDCLQSIADASDQEPRQPDDADWRFRFLESQRAAKCALASLAAPQQSPRLVERLTDVVTMLDAPDAYNLEYIAAVCRSILATVTSTDQPPALAVKTDARAAEVRG